MQLWPSNNIFESHDLEGRRKIGKKPELDKISSPRTICRLFLGVNKICNDNYHGIQSKYCNIDANISEINMCETLNP